MMIRIGSGFDVHAFGESQGKLKHEIMLGGINVLSDFPIIAHSDGDVLLHALADALLGSIGEGDIGIHFPPSDPQWRGVPSSIFVKKAMGMLADRGFSVINADVTIICEHPKISPYNDKIRESIAKLLNLVNLSDINVKSTTVEGLGAIGSKEGIAVHVVCLVGS